MNKITIIILSFVLLAGCNSTKKVEKTISKGDFNRAIEIAVKKLTKNKDSKKKQKYVLLLEDAFKRAAQKDHRDLLRYEKDSNPAVIEQIYKTYIALDKRQELIRPILPLKIIAENRNANFKFEDYIDNIHNSKATLSDYLYANAMQWLEKNTIESARKAYDDLLNLNKINPNFKNVNQLLEEAHLKGTNFVLVSLVNQSNQMIPRRLEDDLLNFDTYGLDEFWTVFHSHQDQKIDYSYHLNLLFKQIDISPERILEKQTLVEKEIKDGKEFLLGNDGHVVRDSLGNTIQVDKFIKVKANFNTIHQEKACHIAADAVLKDKNENRREAFPLESEFIFVNEFAEINGDKRALDAQQLELLNKYEVPFPTNEQLVYDTGEDLKAKLKKIIEDINI